MFAFLFSYASAKRHAPLLLMLNGERVLHLQGHLTMAESRLVAVQ